MISDGMVGYLVVGEGGEEHLPVRNNHLLALKRFLRFLLLALFIYPDPVKVGGGDVGQIIEVNQVLLEFYPVRQIGESIYICK